MIYQTARTVLSLYAGQKDDRAKAEAVLLAEVNNLRSRLQLARDYVAKVNDDCPPGTDSDRDELLERLDIALERTK